MCFRQISLLTQVSIKLSQQVNFWHFQIVGADGMGINSKKHGIPRRIAPTFL
ncbi:hypothetical protein SAMN05216462_1616 [Xylanibacter ruminicola]|uniref:Uncharacterized protein n=1 Tax=Xylanibacter ruminicola TaxID=839 RepID=A0A1H4BV57_XYLRU|nr:hypothetical protein SAMN05216462_1616 [Xylanibacter ruminicola]